MTLIKRNSALSPLDELFNSFFNEETGNWPAGYGRNFSKKPAVNVEETDNEFILSVAAPGIKKDHFKVEVDHDVLTISSELKEEHEEKNKNFMHREFHMSNFSRSFNLPEGKVDESKIDARYADGVLRVNLPKREEHKPAPSRLIDIK